jgi:hypothetical protein
MTPEVVAALEVETHLRNRHKRKGQVSLEHGWCKPAACTADPYIAELQGWVEQWPGLIYGTEGDEPCTHCVEDPTKPYYHQRDAYGQEPCWTRDELHLASQRTCDFVAAANRLKLQTHLVESFPGPTQGEALTPFVQMMLDWSGQPVDLRTLTRWTLDINWTAIDDRAPKGKWWQSRERRRRDRHAYQQEWVGHLHDIDRFCLARGIERGVIVGSPQIRKYPKTDEGWVDSARQQIQRIRRHYEPDVWAIWSWEDARPGDDGKTWPGVEAYRQVREMVT